MRITIYRGTHEIGGSCVEIEDKGSRIVIDIGMPLVSSNGGRFDIKAFNNITGQQLVQEKVLPDIKGIYPWDKTVSAIDGLLISHAHMDHFGLYSYVRDDINYYLGEGTKKLIDISSLFLTQKSTLTDCTYLKSGHPIHIGSFTIKPFLMDHSAFDAYAFLIESEDGKKVFYSGDFRGHGRKSKVFQWTLENVPKDVDLLMLEGTHIPGSDRTEDRETDIEDKIVEKVKDCPTIVFVTQASQNIDRLVSVYKAAIRTNRLLVIDIYTAIILDTLKDYAKLPHPSKAFDNIRIFYPKSISKIIVDKMGKNTLYQFKSFRIGLKEISEKLSSIIMIMRPSMKKYLDRLGDISGAPLIYSMWKGYLGDESMKPFLDTITKMDLQLQVIHTSGHADIKTLKQLVDALNPKSLVPIHTFHPEAYEATFPGVKILHADDGVAFTI